MAHILTIISGVVLLIVFILVGWIVKRHRGRGTEAAPVRKADRISERQHAT